MGKALEVEESKVQHIARTAKAAQKRKKVKKTAGKKDEWYSVNMNKITYHYLDAFGNKHSKYIGKTTQNKEFYDKIAKAGKIRA